MISQNVSMISTGLLWHFLKQTLARYVLSDFPIRCSSYNIFFYHLKNQIHAKIFPRFTASPLYMGYRITNVMDETSKKRIIETLQSEKYFG